MVLKAEQIIFVMFYNMGFYKSILWKLVIFIEENCLYFDHVFLSLEYQYLYMLHGKKNIINTSTEKK